MSMSLSLSIVEPEKDEFNWTITTSDLLYDLFFVMTEDTLKKHLSWEEQSVLQPTGCDESPLKTNDPKSIKAIIARTTAILIKHDDQFPRAHWIINEEIPGQSTGSADWQDDTGRKWHVDGIHYSVEHRDEVEVRVRFPDAKAEHSWVPVKEVIEVGDRSLKIHSQTWHELCRYDLEQVANICDKAIELSAPVKWCAFY